ncbi:hypothetical protein BDV93DRAFT_604672 [Ceratobasidium sp. AG-I]|nr:hypothetical protein BDV93DRAFT_604672 [Ceratobasidium sp. AG-I]
MSSINSLHPELLSQIFSMFIHDYTAVPKIDVFGSYPVDSLGLGMSVKRANLKRTLVVSSVCGYWRRITLGTSTLWSYALLNVEHAPAQRILDRALVWLDRARAMPLDVFLKIRDMSLFRTILDEVPYSPLHNKQIRSLFLSLVASDHLNILLKSSLGDSVPLTLTSLYVRNHSFIGKPSMLQDWLTRCKELEVLQLSADFLRGDDFPILPKLVELELFPEFPASFATKQLVNMLHACPNLQRLKLNEVLLDDTTEVNLPPVSFSHLKALVLEYVGLAGVLPLISSKSSSFNLSIIDDELDQPSDSMADRIRVFSGQTRVTGLNLTSDSSGRGDLHKLLCLFPHLLTLSLVNIPFDNLMNNASWRANELDVDARTSSPTYPNLQAIWLTECEFKHEEALRTLVRVCSPKQLKLDHCALGRPVGSILKAKSLHEYLLNAVPDLTIIE